MKLKKYVIFRVKNTIEISFDSYLELEKIANGTFSGCKGFMNEEDFYSVIKDMRLSNGKFFNPRFASDLANLINNLKKSQEINLVY